MKNYMENYIENKMKKFMETISKSTREKAERFISDIKSGAIKRPCLKQSEKILKAGDIIDIPKKYQKELQARESEFLANTQTIEILSVKIRDQRRKFFEFLEELFPEIKNYSVSYDSQDNIIMIKRKLSENEIK
jgi:hypothetical protein